MTAPDEYQRYANECIAWARKAQTDAERKAFLDMARAWTKAYAKATGEPLPDILERPLREEHLHRRERKFSTRDTAAPVSASRRAAFFPRRPIFRGGAV